MGPEQRFLVLGLLAPATLTGVLLLLAWVSRDAAQKAARGWLGALAVGGAYLLGQAAAFSGVPALPPLQATGRVFWLVAGAVLLAAAESLLAERRWPRLALRGAFVFFVPWYLLGRLLSRRETVEVALVVGSIGLGLLLVWLALAAWSSRREGASVPLVLWWVTSGGALALLLTGTAKYAQFAGILAASLGAAVVVAWLRPSFVLGAGAAGVVAVLHACLWICGAWLSDLPPEVALLLALAPLLATAAELDPLTRLTPRKAVLARLALASLAVVPAVFLAWIQAPPPSPY